MLELGFFGFVTTMVRLPALAVARSATGTVIVNEVPAALGVPVSAGLLPIVTSVEVLKPVPVSVIVCVEVAPAIRPVLGEIADCVGTALSMFVVTAGDVVLSVVTKS